MAHCNSACLCLRNKLNYSLISAPVCVNFSPSCVEFCLASFSEALTQCVDWLFDLPTYWLAHRCDNGVDAPFFAFAAQLFRNVITYSLTLCILHLLAHLLQLPFSITASKVMTLRQYRNECIIIIMIIIIIIINTTITTCNILSSSSRCHNRNCQHIITVVINCRTA